MSDQDSLAIVRRGYEAFQSGDIPALLSLLAEDVQWESPAVAGVPFGGKHHGRQGVAEFFRQLTEAEEFLLFEAREFIAQGERVVVIGRTRVRVKSTGHTIESPWVHIFTVRNGKVSEFLELYDTAAAEHGYQRSASA